MQFGSFGPWQLLFSKDGQCTVQEVLRSNYTSAEIGEATAILNAGSAPFLLRCSMAAAAGRGTVSIIYAEPGDFLLLAVADKDEYPAGQTFSFCATTNRDRTYF